MRIFIASLFLIFTIALSVQSQSLKKSPWARMIPVPGLDKNAPTEFACPSSSTMRHYLLDAGPDGIDHSTWVTALVERIPIDERRTHLFRCADSNLTDAQVNQLYNDELLERHK